MNRRDFVKPTEQEIEERRNMYAKAEELGIDLLKFDDNDKEDRIKRDIRKAIIFLGEGKEVPPELKKDYYREKKKSAERLQKQGVPLIITTRISEILFFGPAAQYYGSAL